MKITIGQLKRIIKEAISNEVRFEGTRDEIASELSNLPKDSIATKEYLDSETGEIYPEPGDVINKFFELTTNYRDRKPHGSTIVDEFDDIDHYSLLNNAIDELITDYEGISYGAIPDFALNIRELLYINNPDVDEWLESLDMTKRDLLDMIKDRLAELIYT